MNEVEVYISQFDSSVQHILQRIRLRILEWAPEAKEQMAYGMPGYKTHNKPLIYFAAFKKHLGLYATPAGHEAFQAELSVYKQGKGSVQFPLNKPIPFDLIDRIIRHRIEENAVLAQKDK